MRRNRRNSFAMSCAIGKGCVGLFVASVGVCLSVAKIVMGTEYVDRCPRNDMVPVYVIISGCLPVFLSGLRQPYDSGHSQDKSECRNTFLPIISGIGVVVNMAWLVAGTVLVFGVRTHGPVEENQCLSNISDTNDADKLWKHNLTENIEHLNGSIQLNDLNTTFITANLSAKYVADRNVHNISIALKTNTSESGLLNETDIANKVIDVGNKTVTDGEEGCIDTFCDEILISFALAVIACDWFVVTCGVIYGCILCCRKLCLMKDEIALQT